MRDSTTPRDPLSRGRKSVGGERGNRGRKPPATLGVHRGKKTEGYMTSEGGKRCPNGLSASPGGKKVPGVRVRAFIADSGGHLVHNRMVI